MTGKNGGCAFGKVSREKIGNLKESFGFVEKKIDKLDIRITELFNHQSNRLPAWATITIAVMTAIIGGLIGVAFR